MIQRGCAHHWRIPEPDGRARLPGECLLCGVVREFRVAGDQYDWIDSAKDAQRRHAASQRAGSAMGNAKRWAK